MNDDRNYRDAGTGEFVTQEHADENPETTVSEPRGSLDRPSVGCVVHYVSYGTPGGEYESQCRAAIITAVEDSVYAPRRDVALARARLADAR